MRAEPNESIRPHSATAHRGRVKLICDPCVQEESIEKSVGKFYRLAHESGRGKSLTVNKTYSINSPEISDYVGRLYRGYAARKKSVRARASRAGLPDIHVGPMDALHLEVIVRAVRAKKAVEIGTLAGYSGESIARGLAQGGKLYTLECEPKHAAVARETFRKAGLLKRVEILTGPAMESLKRIEAKGPFDFVFIDADKVNYSAYLDWAAKHLRAGGVMAADNTFAFGLIAGDSPIEDPRRNQNVRALRAFNLKVARHPKFVSTILPTGEGLTIAVKR